MTRYIRGGNTGTYDLETTRYITTANGCFRTILIREFADQAKPDRRSKYTWAIGTLSESLVVDEFRTMFSNVEADVEVQEMITENVGITGHIDAICDDVTYELKSISSVNSYKKIIQKGEYKPENVLQLVNYMLIREKCDGVLLYTSMLYPGVTGAHPGDQRAFAIKIDNEGGIWVDDELFKFGVKHILGHRQKAAELVDAKKIYAHRPESMDPVFHCCKGCNYAPACDTFEFTHSPQAFWEETQKLLDTPKIK
jgi:hypothetical protein